MAASRATYWDDAAGLSRVTEDDGSSAERARARLEGWDASGLTWRRVGVDSNGALKLAANVSVDLGSVDQGAAGSQAWKVDGSSVTQPVSAAALPLPTGAATETTLAAVNTKLAGTLAVSGPLTDTQLRATPVPISGTFWQATQPVSGTFWQATQPVSIASMPSTPVTGTFWQATQPVSIATMPSTPVTGTFWQATQPVSNAGTFAVQATLTAETTKVIGTVNQGTSPWVVSRNWTLASGTDSVNVGNFPAGFANTDDVTDRVARLLGHVTVDNATLSATQSGSWTLSGSDGVSTFAVSARQHNGYTHLYVRDQGVIGVLSELVHEIRLLREEPVNA